MALGRDQVEFNKGDETAPFDDLDNTPRQEDEAFLIVNGVDLFPIKQAIVSMGRRIDNVLVVNDPRVSRTHAELRCIHGRYVVFDMDSSGGTYVNGQRVKHSVVYDGDVISLAGVHMIFRQRNLPRPDLKKTAMF
jgi:pSer/pThr/pTyr-binding forkhead associated (FHA) protein